MSKITIIPLRKESGGGSDITLKQDVSMVSNALSKILALRPVSWRWKNKNDGTDVQYGFIAQEVEKTIPDLVTDGTWNDGTTRKFLNTNDMMPYLVGAIKEQQSQIADLQRQIAKLKK
jgi:hypothetical protein